MIKKLLIGVISIFAVCMYLLYRPTENEEDYQIMYTSIPVSSLTKMYSVSGKELQNRITQAATATTESTSSSLSSGEATSTIEKVIQYAESKIGSPYQFGGRGEIFNAANCRAIVSGTSYINAWESFPALHQYEGKEMFDCSGLTMLAFQSVGIDIGTTTYVQITKGQPISTTDRSQWKRGDLIFPSPGHVVMYLGDNKVIEAPQSGELVLERERNLSSVVGVRRII